MAYETQHSREQEKYVDVFEEVKVNKSDLLRQERNKEAQDLISQRTIDARSIFEQNTVTSQVRRIPDKPIRNSILKAQSTISQNVENVTHLNNDRVSPVGVAPCVSLVKDPNEPAGDVEYENNDDVPSDDDSDQFATIKRSPKDIEKKAAISPIEENEPTQIKNAEIDKKSVDRISQPITEQQFVDEVIYGDLNDPGIQARALYDYQAGKLLFQIDIAHFYFSGNIESDILRSVKIRFAISCYKLHNHLQCFSILKDR